MSETTERRPGRRASPWGLVALLVALLVLGLLYPVLHLGDRLAAFRAWIASLGALAPLVYILVDGFVAVPLVAPALAFTVGAAALFGPVLGVVVVVVASNIGAAICFLVARYLGREAVAEWLSGHESYCRIDRMVGDHGALAVLFVRLIPVAPFEVVSYMFGLTGVPFRTYVLWTAVGSFPGAVLYTLGSATIIQAVVTRRFPQVLGIVFLAVLAIILVLMRLAGRELQRRERRRAGKHVRQS